MKATWLTSAGWRLLARASLWAVVAGAAAVGAAALGSDGRTAGLSALTAGTTVVFFVVGHVVQVLCARLDARLLLVASLATYLVQVLAVGALIQTLPGRLDGRHWLFLSVALTVAGWLAGLIRGFRRLRVPVFDSTVDQV
ncbi:MAG: hypothetical protein LBJ44_04395 [Propionibacteriaceae bacterium]|nr:hypothetical protein [Propionibacteriaceae bacterium]